VPATLLVVGLVFAVLVANSLRAPVRPGAVALVAFFPSWVVSELPVHFGVALIAVAGALVAGGALALVLALLALRAVRGEGMGGPA